MVRTSIVMPTINSLSQIPGKLAQAGTQAKTNIGNSRVKLNEQFGSIELLFWKHFLAVGVTRNVRS